MEEKIPDPKHVQEWKKIQAIYLKNPGEMFQYRARCIEGLITGTTLDFRLA